MNNFGGTIRFFSTIFFGAFQHPQDAARQQHATEKKLENVEKRKIISFSYGPKPVFSCQNAQKKALSYCQYVFLGVVQAGSGLDGV
jgi:hypothetical protein